ncbi:prolipoprotein diacylglyceryl transferase [Chloroflexota bacterium]
MIEFSSDALVIFGFEIYYYGILIMSGVVLAAFVAQAEARRKGFETEFLWDSLFWVVIAGLIGARVWHILTPPPSMVERGITTSYYLTHPLDALNFRSGGLGIPGAVIAGLIALYWYAKRQKQDFWAWVDIMIPAVPLGQAVGRWGNFINQELYGQPTDLPWAIFIESSRRLPGYENIGYYHPIFLYESLWNLATVFLLLWLARRYADKLLPGDLLLAYLISYPLIRFLLDFLRLDAAEIGGINANQTVMAVVFVSSVVVLVLRHRKKPAEEVV